MIGDLRLPGLGAGLAEISILFSFRWTGAALACAVMGFPRMVRAMLLSAVTVRIIIGVARMNRTASCASGRA